MAATGRTAACFEPVEFGVRLLTGLSVLLVCTLCELSRRLDILAVAAGVLFVEPVPFSFVLTANGVLTVVAVEVVVVVVDIVWGIGGGGGILANRVSNASSNFLAMNTTSDSAAL